jgi:hypothetical protein
MDKLASTIPKSNSQTSIVSALPTTLNKFLFTKTVCVFYGNAGSPYLFLKLQKMIDKTKKE